MNNKFFAKVCLTLASGLCLASQVQAQCMIPQHCCQPCTQAYPAISHSHFVQPVNQFVAPAPMTFAMPPVAMACPVMAPMRIQPMVVQPMAMLPGSPTTMPCQPAMTSFAWQPAPPMGCYTPCESLAPRTFSGDKPDDCSLEYQQCCLVHDCETRAGSRYCDCMDRNCLNPNGPQENCILPVNPAN